VTGRHDLRREIVVPADRDEVFRFFADAANLERITPPELRFRVLTPQPFTIAEGSLIDYRLSLFGVGFGWRTRISLWDPPDRFVDEQLQGPYREWIHTHEFACVPEGTRITDHVGYRLPMFPAGELAWPVVRRQLDRIFDFRAAVIQKEFAR
jgi:ligand-binding SRPBCC domain-containing protein